MSISKHHDPRRSKASGRAGWSEGGPLDKAYHMEFRGFGHNGCEGLRCQRFDAKAAVHSRLPLDAKGSTGMPHGNSCLNARMATASLQTVAAVWAHWIHRVDGCCHSIRGTRTWRWHHCLDATDSQGPGTPKRMCDAKARPVLGTQARSNSIVDE